MYRTVCIFRKLLLNVLTIFAFTLPDLCLVLHVFVTSLAIIPRPGHTNYQFGRQRYGWRYVIIVDLTRRDLRLRPTYLLTSSADWAMKKPTVLAGILAPRGLIEILASPPSSGLTCVWGTLCYTILSVGILASRARSSSLSLTKQSSEA